MAATVETAWLIEIPGSQPRYFAGWASEPLSADAFAAVRFQRKQDAQRMLDFLEPRLFELRDAVVREHAWVPLAEIRDALTAAATPPSAGEGE